MTGDGSGGGGGGGGGGSGGGGGKGGGRNKGRGGRDEELDGRYAGESGVFTGMDTSSDGPGPVKCAWRTIRIC